MEQHSCEAYLKDRSKVWQSEGYQKLPAEADAPWVYRKRRFEFTKFSIVDRFCIATCIEGELTTGKLQDFSSYAFKVAMNNKFFLPRGFGNAVVAFPLLVVEEVSDKARNFIQHSYAPKHWSSFEYPVVYSLAESRIYHYESTPTWGAAYYRGFRKDVVTLFA